MPNEFFTDEDVGLATQPLPDDAVGLPTTSLDDADVGIVATRFKNFLADDIPSNDWRETRKAELAATQKLIADKGALSAPEHAYGRFMQSFYGGLASIPEAAAVLASKPAAFMESILPLEGGKVRPTQENLLFQGGQALRDAIAKERPIDPNRPRSFLVDTLPSGAGSMASFIGTGGALKAVGLTKTAGQVAAGVAASGAATGGAEAYREAVAAGADDDTAFKVFAGNAVLGTTEAIPIAGWLNRLNKASGNRLKAAIIEGSEELAQEVFQQFGGNLIAKETYDPKRSLSEGLIEGGAAGFTLGSLMSLVVSAIGGRPRGKQPAPVSPREDAPPPIAREIEPAGTPQFFRQPEAVTKPTVRTQEPEAIPDSLRAEASGASDRVTAAIADRLPITGQDARLAGARDRLPEMGYAYSETDDVFTPVRKVPTPPANVPTPLPSNAQPTETVTAAVPIKETAPLPPVKTPPLLPGERLVTVERPDGTTYLAAFGDKFYDVPKMGGKRASIARVVDDSWSHGALGIGEKIIELEAKPAEIPKAPPASASPGLTPQPDYSRFIKPENKLGEGGNAIAYQVDDDTVLRVPKSGFQPGPRVEVPDPFGGKNFGQVIARVGNSELLRFQKGVPAGVPYGKERWSDKASGIYKKSLELAANMPQEAFDALANDLIELNNKGFQFDPSKASNLLIDASGNRFNVIDISPIAQGSKYRNTADEIAIVLMDNAFSYRYKGDKAELVPLYREIISKVQSASAKTGLLIRTNSSSYDSSLIMAELKGPAAPAPTARQRLTQNKGKAKPVTSVNDVPVGQSTTSAATGEKRIARGTRARNLFDSETEVGGPDILSWIAENMPMMSKSKAIATKSKDWWRLNKSLFDDAAPLARPHHNVIYLGGSMPDQVAHIAYNEGILKSPDVNELWEKISTSSKRRAAISKRVKHEEKMLESEAADHEAWIKATEKGAIRVTGDQLKVGDVMDVEGERTEVIAIDPDTGDVTLQDGKKFGRQLVKEGQTIWVEKLDTANDETDFLEPKDRAFPIYPSLPEKGEGGPGMFRVFGEAVDKWKEAVRAWLEGRPTNKAIVWEEAARGDDKGNVKALTRNIGNPQKPWRITTYWNRNGAYIPSGHQEYATREAGLVEEARSRGITLHEKMPGRVMDEQEVKGYVRMDEVGDAPLFWYTVGKKPLGQIKEVYGFQNGLVIDSLWDGKIAYTRQLDDAELKWADLSPVEPQKKPFQVDDILIWKAPGTGEDVAVNYRGPLGTSQSVVVSKQTRLQLTVETSALRHRDPPPVFKTGDRVTFKPFYQRETSTTGVVQEIVNDGRGYNILSPLPGDPSRVVRVWLEDGDIEAAPPATPTLELDQPESVEEQKARLAREAAAKKVQADKDRLAAEAAKKLKGTAGDLGQGDLLDEPDNLFGLPKPKKPVEASPQVPQKPLLDEAQADVIRKRMQDRLNKKQPPSGPGQAALTPKPVKKTDAQKADDQRNFNDGVQLGAFYIQSGAHKFPEWRERMLTDFGPDIEPQLRSIYETAKITIESPGGEGAAGRPAGLQPGLRQPTERIVTARAEFTKAADEGIIPAELVQHLDEHQRQGAASALRSLIKRGAFLLASGTGAGKTRQALAVAHYYAKLGKKVIIITKAETIKPDWKKNTFGGSYDFDSRAMGVPMKLARDGVVGAGEIGITTYQNLARVEKASDKNTVLIYDESAALKNDSQQAKFGMRAAARADKVMFMSATPADKPEHIYYLAPIGVMEGKTIQAALRDLGMTLVSINKMVKEGTQWVKRLVTFWAEDQNVTDAERHIRFSALFDRMTEQGAALKHEISMDGVHVQVLRLTLPEEAHETMADILRFFDADTIDDLQGLKKASVLMHQRRQQEPFKVAPAVLLAKRELNAGRQVVLFVSRVNESEVGKWVTVTGLGGERERIREVLMSSEGTVKSLREALHEAGIHDIAEIHGNADQNSLEAMADFQAGRKRVVIATIESGGTGINLDDTVGNRPRSMIVVTAPFDAVGNVQAAGRIWRLKTLSDARVFYLFGDTDVDQWNADIIGTKMSMLGAVVEGQVRRLNMSDPELVGTDDFHSTMRGSPKAEQPVPGATVKVPTLDWKPFKTRAGKDKFVAPATKAFWEWYNANGKGDNSLGLRPSKYQGEWQVWADQIPSSGEPSLAEPETTGGLSAAIAQPVIDAWRAANPAAPEVQIINEPERTQIGTDGKTYGVRGWWDGQKILVNLAFVADADAVREVLEHERIHPLLDTAQGEAAITSAIEQELGGDALAQIQKRYKQGANENPESYRRRSMAEWFAQLKESNQSLWQRIVARVREFLAKLGVVDLTDEEIGRAMLRKLEASAEQVSQLRVKNATVSTQPGLVRIGGASALTAYHGTPHKVDKFSTEKIGTGEGAQAYGYGLYFAGLRETADFYRKNLAEPHLILDGQQFMKGQQREFQTHVVERYGIGLNEKQQGRLHSAAFQYFWDVAVNHESPESAARQTIERIRYNSGENADWAKPIFDDISKGTEPPLSEDKSRWVLRSIEGRRGFDKLSATERSAFWDLNGRIGWFKPELSDAPDRVRRDLEKTVSAQNSNLRNAIQRGDKPSETESRRWLAEAQAGLDLLDSGKVKFQQHNPPGKLYTVVLNPEADELLDWDKPLSDQPQVLEILQRSKNDLRGADFFRPGSVPFEAQTGQSFYERLVRAKEGSRGTEMDGKQQASGLLENLGIKGIRFLDQGSRGINWRVRYDTGLNRWLVEEPESIGSRIVSDHATESEARSALSEKQTHNYVVFNDADITITHENGQRVSLPDALAEHRGSASLTQEPVGDDTKHQRTFGADIGEDQNIENVKAIQAALVENGYGIGDTVTLENTSQAWEQFASFVDPAKRADTLAALHAAVPQEMAPGIVHSTLWQYAVRLAATGDPALFRAMTANSNQFVLWDGPTFRSTLGRGLRALGLGADFTTWKNELERTKAQREAIAKELGLNPKDISLIDMLITNLNGATPDAAAVIDAVGNGKLPDGGTVTDVLKKKPAGGSRKPKIDDEAGDELEDAANRTAAEILRRLQLDYAGVEWLKPGSRPLGIIQQILRDHYKGREPILPILGNSNRVIDALAGRFADEAGVEADLAQQLANAAEVKRQSDWTNARNRAIQRAKNSGSLRGLIDEILATPYLAQANPEWVRETAINWFLANGLSREQAEGATALFQTEFNAKLLEAQIKVAERLLAKAPPKNLRDFIEALRAGLLDPDKPWLDAYAKKAGWNVPTRAQFQRLAELELKLQDPNLSASEQAETTEAMTGIYLHLKLPPALMQRIAANFVVTALTGIRTMTVNLFAPLERLVTETALRTVTRPQDFARNIQTLFNAYGKNWAAARRMKFSLHKDAYTFLNNEFTQATNEQRRLWEEAEADFASGDNVRQTKAMVKGLYGSQQFAMRLLNAADQANAMAEREVQLLNYGSAAFREAGLGTQAVTALVQAASRLKQAAYETAIQQGRSPDQAQVDADEVAIEQLEDFVGKELATAGDPDAKTKARQMVEAATKDAYSAIGRLAPGIEETDEGGIVSRVVYHNILKASNFLRGGKGADPILGVSLLGYVSIPFRTGRHMLWNGPYGLLRLGIHHFRKGRGADNQWKQTLANEYQERQRLKLALAGTAAWAMIGALGFALLGKSGDDDAGEEDDFGFYVTGRGPKSKNLRDAWLKSGFRENSLVAFIFGKPIAIPMTRVGEPLAHLFWLLSARDDHSWRKREAEATGKEFKETWSATTGRAIGTYLGMVGQRGLLQNITQWARLGSGEGGSDKVLADLASKTVAGAVLPWLGMQRSLIGMTEGQLDRSSIESAMAANFGIPGVYWNKQAVNRFGDPLGNRTWFGKIGDTGVPLAFQVAETSENQQFYRTLAQKGAAPPELRRYVAEEKYGPLTDDQFSDLARRSGAMLKRAVSQNLSGLERMTPEQVKDYMGKVAGQSDRTAAMALGLTAVKPATRTTAAVEPEAVPLLPAPRRLSSGRVRAAVGRSRGIGLARSRIGRTRLATMRVPRLRAGRARAYLTRSRSFRRPRRVRSAMSRIRRPRLSYA